MAKKKTKTKKTDTYINTFIWSWQTSMFIGMVLFIVGVLMWAAASRIISPDLLWANVLMLVGILFAVKGSFFSHFKQ